MSKPITRRDVDEALAETKSELRGEIRDSEKRLAAGFEQRLTAAIRESESRLRAEIRGTEGRLAYQIADAAARTANAVVERFSEMIKPVDDKANHALAEVRGARTELAEHASDPDAHRR